MAVIASLPAEPEDTSGSLSRSQIEALSDIVVARIGDVTISGREFFTSYEMGPAFVKRHATDNPRLDHLDFMIKEKVMALRGMSERMHEQPDVRQVLEEIRLDRAVEEMYKDDVLSQVEVSDKELEQAVEEASIQVWFRYIRTESNEEGQQVQARLQAGDSFDSLSVASHDPRTQDPINFWQLKQQDATFADYLTNLGVGEVSPLFETPNGVFIAQVDRVYRDPFLSSTQQAEQGRKLEKQIRQLKADSIAYAYAAIRMEEANPVIKREAFNQLFEFFEGLTVDGSRDVDGMLLGNWPGGLDRSGLEETSIELLVTEDGTFTVSDFLDWYDLRRFPVEGATPEQRANRLKSIIWRMLRDRLLGIEAREREYTQQSLVEEEVRWWAEKLVYWESREQLLADVVPSEEEVQRLLNESPHRYRDKDPGKNQKKAFRDAYTLAERRVLIEFFSRDQTQIDVDTLALLSVPINTDRLAKPVELVAFKKEGTFPRIAYPTIDRVWVRY